MTDCISMDGTLHEQLIPVEHRVQALLRQQARVLIAIDGPCGSGKSTLAERLCRTLHCPCVHMDDYHVPHGQKTPERLAQPGGNSHRERLMAEVLLPWQSGHQALVRPYDCRRDALAPATPLPPCPVLVLEGSYSHHPDLWALIDVPIFVQAPPQERLRRLRARSGEGFQAFIDRWIPLEEAYFAAFHLPREGSVCIATHSVQGV